MPPILTIKRAARKAHGAFSSDGNTQLAVFLIFTVVGVVALTQLVTLASEKHDSPGHAHSTGRR